MKNIDFLMTTPLWKGLKEEEIEAILPAFGQKKNLLKKGNLFIGWAIRSPLSESFCKENFRLSMMISGVTKRFSA